MCDFLVTSSKVETAQTDREREREKRVLGYKVVGGAIAKKKLCIIIIKRRNEPPCQPKNVRCHGHQPLMMMNE